MFLVSLQYGGAAHFVADAMLNHVSMNAVSSNFYGGGAYITGRGTVSNSVITNAFSLAVR